MSNSARIVIEQRHLREWRFLHPLLEDVFAETCALWPDGYDIPILSINRTKEEDDALGGSGIHVAGPPWRALDIRTKHLGPHYQQLADDIAERLNRLFTYDPTRPKLGVALAKPHGSGPHLHLQVSPLTQRS